MVHFSKHLALLAQLLSTCSALCTPTATLESGRIVGLQTILPNAEFPINKFLGIPYAAPTERFSMPQEPSTWEGVTQTREFGPSCPQLFELGSLAPSAELLKEVFDLEAPESETHCLTINVFAPATQGPRSGRPVVLFIPGGGFQNGNGRLDMSYFAAHEDIIAMTINYRTNVFGFPKSPEIPVEERNLGLHDQRLAIEWVQANAHAFGGDPGKVTLWGQSAGSISIDMHLLAYGNRDDLPFRGAILSSGQSSIGLLGLVEAPDDFSRWAALTQLLGCGEDPTASLECVKNVPYEVLLGTISNYTMSFSPVIDGVTRMPMGSAAWRAGNVSRVPIMTGTTAQEGRSLLMPSFNMAEFEAAFLGFLGDDLKELVLSTYRAKPSLETDFDVATAIYTDFLWQCPQAILANYSSSIGLPTWRYVFNTSTPELFPQEYEYMGACHGCEIVLTLSSFEETAASPQLYAVSRYMRGAFADFIRSPSWGPPWTRLDSGLDLHGVALIGDVGNSKIGGGSMMVSATDIDGSCAFYDGIYPLIENLITY